MAVEGFDEAILPRRAGVDVTGVDVLRPAPGGAHLGAELRTVVQPQEPRGRAPPGGDGVQDGDRRFGADAPGGGTGQGLSGELVGDVEDLDGPPPGRLVEDEVDGPDVIGGSGTNPVRVGPGLALPRPSTGHVGALVPPQALGRLAR